MDEQAREIGRRVRYWRLRRNYDRQRFADMVLRAMVRNTRGELGRSVRLMADRAGVTA